MEIHNALGEDERYHAVVLCLVYNNIRAESPQIDEDLALVSAVKVINDTAGPARLVPTLLIFVFIARIPVSPKDLPDHISRMKAIRDSLSEMDKIVAKARLNTLKTQNVPGAADADVKIGDKGLIFREKPIEKWSVRPFIAIKAEGKLVTLDTGFRTILASIHTAFVAN